MQQQVKHRSKFTATLLALISFFVPGVGQLAGGRLRLALVLFGVSLSLSAILCFSSVMDNFYSAVFALFTPFLFGLFVAFNAFKINSTKQGVTLKWYNKWYYYIPLFALFILAPSPNVLHYYRTFNIASDSNTPTLQVGDHIIIKSENTKNLATLSSQYKPGTLIVFNVADLGNKSWVKRIVAQGGDKFFIKNGIAFLNDKPVNETYVLPKNKTKPESTNLKPITVPLGHVFVLGDNRDNSADSRYFGFVAYKDIQGKPLYIFWSRDFHRIGLKLL